MRYENGSVLAEGNLLMLHGRFSGIGTPANWIALDIVRLEDGRLKEHWDVIEDEATRVLQKRVTDVWCHVPRRGTSAVTSGGPRLSHASIPPLTPRIVPVMNDAPSDPMNTMARAISSELPVRLSGTRARPERSSLRRCR